MVGKSVKPTKDVPLLKGSGIFTDDIKLPDMVYAAFVRSPYAHARIKRIDASRALQLEGVVWVMTGRETARQLVSWMNKPGLRTPERLSLAREKVRYVGEPVAAVAATSRAIAEDAVELVEVEYEPLPVVVDAERALEAEAPLLYEDWGDNVIYHEEFRSGGTEAAFKEADVVFSERLVSHRYSPTPIETSARPRDYDQGKDTL